LEKPSGNLVKGDRLPTTAAFARRMSLHLGLMLQLLRKHRTSDGVADFGGFLFHVDELRSPGRTASRSMNLVPQFRCQRLDPFPQLLTNGHP
jgi:hypothetical protein